jgi:hypothetical protein
MLHHVICVSAELQADPNLMDIFMVPDDAQCVIFLHLVKFDLVNNSLV